MTDRIMKRTKKDEELPFKKIMKEKSGKNGRIYIKDCNRRYTPSGMEKNYCTRQDHIL